MQKLYFKTLFKLIFIENIVHNVKNTTFYYNSYPLNNITIGVPKNNIKIDNFSIFNYYTFIF